MNQSDQSDERVDLNVEVRDVWDRNAAFWDEYMGEEGNDFHRLLVSPAAERLLSIRPGEEVLEIACGSGIFARRLAELGAHVLATDFSPTFIERARARSEKLADRIEFRIVDAANVEALRALGEHRFDAVVSNMALMDMADIEPLAAALPHLLKAGGRFVFTIMHPCFNTTGCTMLAEQEDAGGAVTIRYSVRVTRYLSPSVDKGIGIMGQPAPQYYFNRPLHRLFAPFFAAGLALDGLEEPAFDPSVPSRRPTGWGGNFHEIPPVLAARLRR